MAEYKLGRRPMVAPKMMMKFGDFQKKTFPTPPVSGDYSPKAMPALNRMYCNDTRGCCVPAWFGHAIGVFTGNATGIPVQFTDDQILQMYSVIGGFDPANPDATDNGCDENVALDYWQNTGFLGHKIQGALSVDATNWPEVQDCVWLLENVMFGIGLPQAYVDPFPTASGFVWKLAGPSIPDNGHCFGSMKWSPSGLGISTWAMLGTMEPDAIAAYAVNSAGGQLFAVITQEILDRGVQKAPNGFAWTDLVAYFNGMGGNLKFP